MSAKKPRYGLSEFLASIPVGSFDGRPDYYVLTHSHRCVYHQAHPFSITQHREILYSKLLQCTDSECYVALGTVTVERQHGIVKQTDAHRAYKTETGHRHGYISREERRRNAYSDPKNTRELVGFLNKTNREKDTSQ